MNCIYDMNENGLLSQKFQDLSDFNNLVRIRNRKRHNDLLQRAVTKPKPRVLPLIVDTKNIELEIKDIAEEEESLSPIMDPNTKKRMLQENIKRRAKEKFRYQVLDGGDTNMFLSEAQLNEFKKANAHDMGRFMVRDILLTIAPKIQMKRIQKKGVKIPSLLRMNSGLSEVNLFERKNSGTSVVRKMKNMSSLQRQNTYVGSSGYKSGKGINSENSPVRQKSFYENSESSPVRKKSFYKNSEGSPVRRENFYMTPSRKNSNYK